MTWGILLEPSPLYKSYALYNASHAVATNGTYDLQKSADYPKTLYTGSSFLESCSSWLGTLFRHGFNLGNNQSTGRQTLLATVPLASKALEKGKLYNSEYSNELDLYSTSIQGPVRPSTWDE